MAEFILIYAAEVQIAVQAATPAEALQRGRQFVEKYPASVHHRRAAVRVPSRPPRVFDANHNRITFTPRLPSVSMRVDVRRVDGKSLAAGG